MVLLLCLFSQGAFVTDAGERQENRRRLNYEYEDNEVMSEFKQMAYARSTYPNPGLSEWGASTFYDPVWNMVFSWGLGTPSNGTTWLAPYPSRGGPEGCDPELREGSTYLQWRPQKSRIGVTPAYVPRTTTCMDLNWCGMPAQSKYLGGSRTLRRPRGVPPGKSSMVQITGKVWGENTSSWPSTLDDDHGKRVLLDCWIAKDMSQATCIPALADLYTFGSSILPDKYRRPRNTGLYPWLYFPPDHRECFSTRHRDRSDDFSYWYSRDVRTYDYHGGQTRYADHPVAYTGKIFQEFYSGPEDTVNHVTAKMLNRPKGTINRNLFCVYWATEKGDVRAACKDGVEEDHWAGTRVDGHGLKEQLWENVVHLTPGDEERVAAYKAINLNVLAYTKKSDRFRGNHVYTHVIFAGRLVCTFYAPTKEVHCAIWDDDREETNDLNDHFPGTDKAWHEESMPYGHRQHATSIGWYDSNGGTGHGDPETSDIFVFMWCRFSRCLPLYVDAAGRPTFLINGLVTKLSRMPVNPDDYTSSSWRDKTFSVVFPDRMNPGDMRFDGYAQSGGYMATYTLTPYGGKKRPDYGDNYPGYTKKPQHEKGQAEVDYDFNSGGIICQQHILIRSSMYCDLMTYDSSIRRIVTTARWKFGTNFMLDLQSIDRPTAGAFSHAENSYSLFPDAADDALDAHAGGYLRTDPSSQAMPSDEIMVCRQMDYLECKFFDMSDPDEVGCPDIGWTYPPPYHASSSFACARDEAKARSGKVDIGPPSYRGASLKPYICCGPNGGNTDKYLRSNDGVGLPPGAPPAMAVAGGGGGGGGLPGDAQRNLTNLASICAGLLES